MLGASDSVHFLCFGKMVLKSVFNSHCVAGRKNVLLSKH